MIPANGNARAIGVILVGIEFAHDFCVGDFLEPIGGGVLIFDDEEGAGALDMRDFARGIGSNAFTQAAYFFCSKIGSMCVGIWDGGRVGGIQVSGQFQCPGQAYPSGQLTWRGTGDGQPQME